MSLKLNVEITIDENEASEKFADAQSAYLEANPIPCPHCGTPSIAPGLVYNCPVCKHEIRVTFG